MCHPGVNIVPEGIRCKSNTFGPQRKKIKVKRIIRMAASNITAPVPKSQNWLIKLSCKMGKSLCFQALSTHVCHITSSHCGTSFRAKIDFFFFLQRKDHTLTALPHANLISQSVKTKDVEPELIATVILSLFPIENQLLEKQMRGRLL